MLICIYARKVKWISCVLTNVQWTPIRKTLYVSPCFLYGWSPCSSLLSPKPLILTPSIFLNICYRHSYHPEHQIHKMGFRGKGRLIKNRKEFEDSLQLQIWATATLKPFWFISYTDSVYISGLKCMSHIQNLMFKFKFI